MSHSRKPAIRPIAFVIAMWVIIPLPIRAQEEASPVKVNPAPPRVLTDEQQAELREVQRFAHHAQLCWRRKQFAEARDLVTKAVEINSRIQGPDHASMATLLNDLGAYHMELQDYKKAKDLLTRAIKIWDANDGHLGTANSLFNLAETHRREHDYRNAIPLYRRTLDIRQKLLGKYHPQTLEVLNPLANQYLTLAQYKNAKPLLDQALQATQESLGTEHPHAAICLTNLGSYYLATAEYDRAIETYSEALAISLQHFGPDHTTTQFRRVVLGMACFEAGDLSAAERCYAEVLQALKTSDSDEGHSAWVENNGGAFYLALGQYRKAESLLLSALSKSERVHGKSHPETMAIVNNVAALYSKSGDYSRAEPYFLRVIADNERFLGPEHPQLAQSLSNLAEMYTTLRAFTKAEPLLKRALTISEVSLGERHPSVATICNNLGQLYSVAGHRDKAKEYYLRALDIRESHFGPNHPLIAASLPNLGHLHAALKEFQEAERCYERAALITEARFGSDSADMDYLYTGWGSAYSLAGDYKKAEPLLRRGLEGGLKRLEDEAVYHSERQQLRRTILEGPKLQDYFCLAMCAPEYAENCYGYLLRWKGTVLARQQMQRAAADDLSLATKLAELQTVTTRLSRLALKTPLPHQEEAWKRETIASSAAKERLEKELSQQSEAFRDARARRVSPAELQAALPNGTAVVDIYIEQLTLNPDLRNDSAHVAAFVLTNGQPLKLVAPATSGDVRQAIESWRAGSYGVTAESRKAGEQLRKLLWEPLEKYLPGVKTVLISPYGELNKLPFGALPGRKPGSYLIEDFAFAIVPVPSVLVNPLNARLRGETSSLLAVGDVDYDVLLNDSVPGSTVSVTTRAATGGKELRFDPLAGTGPEVLAVGRAFRAAFPQVPPIRLAGDQATEDAFRTAAPKHRFLHLATHGFFAEPAVRSALARNVQGYDQFQRQTLTDQTLVGYHPDLLSGIVLAGANRPAEDGDDGILTAAEVQTIDLRGVELVTLSACETGLGQTAGGEGLLGLQRAFQVAGAKNVVASLWKVDDAATQALMTEFYANLWQKKLPPIEALRQAQLRMIVDYKPAEGKLRAGFTEKRIDEKALAEARIRQKSEGQLLPPFYWAGFVISGAGR